MILVLVEAVKNIKTAVEDNKIKAIQEDIMLNVQEYRHELDAMSENIQELSVSL